MTLPIEGNLPQDRAAFIGREAELAHAHGLLSRAPLLTLTGPGGVGKTRLALKIANRMRTTARDGVWMVDLSALQGATPDRIYTYIAFVLGIRRHGTLGLDIVLEHLSNRRLLLLLDNCEHLVSATRTCVTELLNAAPHLRILATSRQALHVDVEQTLVVPPLSHHEAITLFTATATAAGVDLARVDAHAVADLCRRLDGLPLAIRLAAGRVRTLSVQQLLDRLDDRFRLLTDTTHGAGDLRRHSTLQQVVDWSYEHCTTAEQQLWARAAVFSQGFDLRAVEAVCAGHGIDRRDIVDLVSALVDKSVLTIDDGAAAGSPARYYLLDTLRDYGLRKLDATGETQRVRAAHRDHYQQMLADAAAAWFGPGELETMAAVHRDMPDILAAVDESLARQDLSAARAICRDLVRTRTPFFWGLLDLVAQQFGRVLAASHAAATPEEAADLAATRAAAAWVAVTQGNDDCAQALLTAAHEVLDQWRTPAIAPVLFAEGGSEALGFGSLKAIDLLASARAAFAAAPAEFNTAGDEHMATMMWAMACAFAAKPATAVDAGEEYLRKANESQAPWAISWALWVAALAALRDDDHPRAADLINQALRLQRDMDDHWGQTWSLELCAWIIAARLSSTDNAEQEAQRAAWLLGAARARQRKVGVSLGGMRPLSDRHAAAYAQITAWLTCEQTAAQMEAGSRGHAQAVRIALGEPTTRRATAAGPEGLTDREREVARLVAQGFTSAEIGAQLRIGHRTVDVHVRNIMRKLDVRRRVAIATWVAAQPDSSHPNR